MNGRDLVAHAALSGEPLVTEAKRHAKNAKQASALVARALRYLKRSPGGMEFRDLFLKSKSGYEADASVRLVCPREEVLGLVDKGSVPLTWLVEGARRRQSSYTYWYNRLLSKRPQAIQSKRTIGPGPKPASLSGSRTPIRNAFLVQDHEYVHK